MNLLDNQRAYYIALAVNGTHEQLKALNNGLKLGIIKSGDALTEYNELTKKELKLKETLVRETHRRYDGTSRIISHHLPTDKNPYDYWITIMENGKRIRESNYDTLIDRLYRYYTGALADNSIRAIFEAAIHEKQITENPKNNTIKRQRADYHRYITHDFASMDIRDVTTLFLKEYTQKWVNADHPKKKAYLAYKGILNLVFGYAMIHRIISTNPVKAINNNVYLKSCDLSQPEPSEKILSPEEIDLLRTTVRKRMTMKKYGRYYINGFALLFSIETGVRVGELCSLKWADIREDCIHIHSQQLSEEREKGHTTYYYDPHTKNEKGISCEGRDFPLTDAIDSILFELKSLQNELGIQSDFIFCHENGEWIKTDAYLTFLRRLCTSLGFKVTNNHALRMSLNSNVLIPLGISAPDRAAMLGHSVETNLRNYSFAQKSYIEDVRKRLNTGFARCDVFRNTSKTPKIVQFSQIKKAQNH